MMNNINVVALVTAEGHKTILEWELSKKAHIDSAYASTNPTELYQKMQETKPDFLAIDPVFNSAPIEEQVEKLVQDTRENFPDTKIIGLKIGLGTKLDYDKEIIDSILTSENILATIDSMLE